MKFFYRPASLHHHWELGRDEPFEISRSVSTGNVGVVACEYQYLASSFDLTRLSFLFSPSSSSQVAEIPEK